MIFDEPKLTIILTKLLTVLQHLAEHDITMRNLSPTNVFISPDSPNDVLITDLGFADIPGI